MTGEFVRYVLVGLAVNAVLFAVYLGLTAVGADPKLASTAVFAAAVPLSFRGHRAVTFRAAGDARRQAVRFGIAYLAAWAAGVGVLWAAVDVGRAPHAPIEALVIAGTAATMFAVQRWWVFR